MPLPDAVNDIDDGRFGRHRFEDRRNATAGVLVHRHDRAGIDIRRPEQAVAVLPRPRVRPLVRADAGPERLEAHARKEPASREDLVAIGSPELLFVDVHGRAWLLANSAFSAPGREESRRAPVPVVRIGVTGLGGREVQANHVAWVSGQEVTVLVKADDVVRRGDHATEISDDLGVKAERAERTNDGHVDLGWTRLAAGCAGNSADPSESEPGAGTRIVR